MGDFRINQFSGVYTQAVQQLERLEEKLEMAKARRSPNLIRLYERLIAEQQEVVEGAAALCDIDDEDDVAENPVVVSRSVASNPKCYEGPKISDYEGMKVQYVTGNFKFPKVDSVLDFVQFANDLAMFQDVRERVYAVYLNPKHQILGYRLVGAGTVDAALVDMKVVFGPAVTLHAASVAILHNHPSGSLHFSEADRTLAKMIYENCKLLNVRFLDFVVVGGGQFFSLSDDEPEFFQG